MPDCDRDLDFAALLGELQALIGERVVLEVAGRGRAVALEARGTLAHLSDLQLDLGRSLQAPGVVAFSLDESGASFSLREAEILSARAYTVGAVDDLAPSRHVQVLMRGGLELIVGVDRLVELFDT